MFRLPLIPFVLALLAGCDRTPLKERVDAIHERNAKLDQVSKIRVTQQVRKHWTIIEDRWFGKLPDGSILRLDSPVVTVKPVKIGKLFCCNWLGEVTLTAVHWHSQPASNSREPFTMKYQAVLESEGRYSLTAIAGKDVTSPEIKEVANFAAFPSNPDSR